MQASIADKAQADPIRAAEIACLAAIEADPYAPEDYFRPELAAAPSAITPPRRTANG